MHGKGKLIKPIRNGSIRKPPAVQSSGNNGGASAGLPKSAMEYAGIPRYNLTDKIMELIKFLAVRKFTRISEWTSEIITSGSQSCIKRAEKLLLQQSRRETCGFNGWSTSTGPEEKCVT